METKAFIDNSGKIVIENAGLLFKNFAGAGNEWNHEGDRNFCCYIDNPQMVEDLRNDGWNVKLRASREEDEPARSYIKVNVSYRFKGPKIFVHEGANTVELTEDTVADLDIMDNVLSYDVVIEPYHWRKQNKEGVSGYLRELHVVRTPNYFANKDYSLQ